MAFTRAFEPRDGVDYGWVVEYARDWYLDTCAQFAAADARADALAKQVGGVTGLVTAGAAAAVAGSSAPAWLLLTLLPSFVFAVGCVALSTFARQSVASNDPPDVVDAIHLAEHPQFRAVARPEDGPSAAEAVFAAHWNLAATRNTFAINARQRWIDRSLWCLVLAAVLLVLPFAGVIAAKSPAGPRISAGYDDLLRRIGLGS